MCFWNYVTRENVERYAEGPFNCLNTSWRMPREHLDLCREKGLLAICGADSGFDHADEGRKWLTDRVLAMKDHPALMGWFVCDELPLSDIPMLKRRQAWMEALDPDHPTWYAQDVVREARHYLGVADGLVFYAYQHILEPHDDPEDAFEPAWARTKAMAEEFKRYIDVFLSVDSAPAVSSSNGDVAVRTWRYKGDTYLLAVNCTTNAQTATLTLSENVGGLVSCDFGSAPKIDGNRVEVSLEPIGCRMVRFRFSQMRLALDLREPAPRSNAIVRGKRTFQIHI